MAKKKKKVKKVIIKKALKTNKKKETKNKQVKPNISKKKQNKADSKPLTVHKIKTSDSGSGNIIDTYEYRAKNIPIKVTIVRRKGEFVPLYEVSVASISKTTEFMLERIRQELVKAVNLEMVDLTDLKKTKLIENQFEETIGDLIRKYFPDLDDETKGFLTSYLMTKSLGLGMIEFVMNDYLLEEVVINEATEPIWVFHRKHGWLKSNVFLRDEEQTRHFASIIGRKVGRQITVLEPLLDAHLEGGDRVNATLMPISTAGNTITFRKFARDPWTITKFIQTKTISVEAAALIWMAMQYELSAIIAGGTASGKTSALNCFANFFPPNQRIISIEDTREVRLPKFLHWVPMNTRLPNAEGKGEISMEDLLINSLRMRPDRILVGEVRRKRESETLFEAIHTGHSVYATFHANNAQQTVERLTNPPIDVPKIMLPAISLIIVQFRNRRTGTRRTFQIAEILDDSTVNIMMQYDQKKDKLVKVNPSKSLFKTLKLYTGMSDADIKKDLAEKEKVLNYLMKHEITDVDEVGRVIAEYFTNKSNIMKFVNANKKFED
ncbi:MAG: type II/IV secretion system ATPase subunit [Nanoarchaeota archaeon]|nr:type II/IV secretion system ATPase subunit [Nanoarchaeota archaeon]MBU1597392.1 type II/IV secretion system ATPase subunit [Nanoarchaeota archaeon]